MKRAIACATIFSWAMLSGAASATTAGEHAIAAFSAAWAKVDTYSCSITAHEVSGSNVQDRVYDMWFQKSPIMARMNITGGDGKGSAVIWDGSGQVYGHKGGFLISAIKKHLDLHDPQATSIRGTTVADASFGAILTHLQALKGATVDASVDGADTDVTVTVADPSSDQDVTKEMIVLGPGSLPIEYDQWQGSAQVKHVLYTNVQLNGQLPANIFTL